MTEPREKLSATQVRDASLADWRQILGRIKARFHTGDFRTGLALVNMIGAAAEAANHHPDIQLTYSDVIVTLTSHDAGGITSLDLDLARQISSHAAGLGVDSDAGGLTQLELGLDTALGSQLAPFYAALLGGTVEDGEPVDPSGQVPTVWWQEPDGDDVTLALPEQPFEQRWHFDVWVAHDEGERRLQAVLDAGGRLVSDRAAPAYWVVEDADGNRSCICTPAGRRAARDPEARVRPAPRIRIRLSSTHSPGESIRRQSAQKAAPWHRGGFCSPGSVVAIQPVDE